MMSLRTSPQAGVAIPWDVRKPKGIPTPVCALARNDILFCPIHEENALVAKVR